MHLLKPSMVEAFFWDLCAWYQGVGSNSCVVVEMEIIQNVVLLNLVINKI
jgi:hypothetical protein